MAGRRKRARGTTNAENIAGAKTPDASGYEQSRDRRIKENKEKMLKLGLFDLPLKLKSQISLPKRSSKNPSEIKLSRFLALLAGRPEVEGLVPVRYAEFLPKGERGSWEDDVEICIKEGLKPEIYTEEHEKLFGDCQSSWTQLVDGHGEDGKRIYDNVDGETCHQCMRFSAAAL